MIISNNYDTPNIEKLLKSGINNYILKTCDKTEFEQALTAALHHRKYFCAEVLNGGRR